MRILGMVTHTHDTGVATINNGRLEFVLEEERLNREKKTQRFPAQSLDAAFSESGITLRDVDAITMPWNIPRFWRTLAWAFLRKFPRSSNLVHVRSHPVQQNQLFRGTRYLAMRLREHFGVDDLPPLYGVGHHDAHAASFFMSPFEEATVLVMDGYGDDAATSVYVGAETACSVNGEPTCSTRWASFTPCSQNTWDLRQTRTKEKSWVWPRMERPAWRRRFVT